MLLQSLEKKELISPPTWLASNTQYLTVMGSQAYGVSTDNSDLDIYGVTIPPRNYVFPHEAGLIHGFSKNIPTFNQWQEHHIKDQSANGGNGQEYDFSIYGIVQFFFLVMNNNPNMIDSLFVNRESIIHITKAFEEVRKNRKLFLHKGIAHKLRGYAFSQMHKAKNSEKYVSEIRQFEKDHNLPHTLTQKDIQLDNQGLSNKDYHTYGQMFEKGISKTSRFEQQKTHGYDRKFTYHIFRLADQAEYILTHHDLDLQERGRVEKMKAVRRGDISFEDIVKTFGQYETRIDNLYQTSKLRMRPDEDAIKNLLLTVLEHHFGSIDKAFKGENRYQKALNEIQNVCRKYGV